MLLNIDEIAIQRAGVTPDMTESIVREHFPFPSFNNGQLEAITDIVNAIVYNGIHHVILDAPTGVGKSVIAYTVHKTIEDIMRRADISNWRTTVCTATKALQEQYIKDFIEADNLMGKTNYGCPHGAKNYRTVSCVNTLRKKICRGAKECPYQIARKQWCYSSRFRITNSALAIKMCPMLCMQEENYAPFMIIDECHKMPNTIKDQLELKFSIKEIDQYKKMKLPGATLIHDNIVKLLEMSQSFPVGKIINFPQEFVEVCGVISELCVETTNLLADKLEMLQDKPDSDRNPYVEDTIVECLFYLDELSNLTELCTEVPEAAMIVYDLEPQHFDESGNTQWSFTLKPVFARDVVEYGLYRKNAYFLHMSATICGADKYAYDMGLNYGQYHTVTVDNPIPAENRQVNYIPVGKMSKREMVGTMPAMIEAIADIIRDHEGENGIVHVSSYQLAEDLIKRMPPDINGSCIIGKNKKDVMQKLRWCTENNTRCIVFSPSMKEGVDLKGKLGEFGIIAKVPFGNLGDPLIKYMADKDKGWYIREVVLDIVQSTGRVCRGVNDFGVNYILDESFGRVMVQGSDYFPDWWLNNVTSY